MMRYQVFEKTSAQGYGNVGTYKVRAGFCGGRKMSWDGAPEIIIDVDKDFFDSVRAGNIITVHFAKEEVDGL